MFLPSDSVYNLLDFLRHHRWLDIVTDREVTNVTMLKQCLKNIRGVCNLSSNCRSPS